MMLQVLAADLVTKQEDLKQEDKLSKGTGTTKMPVPTLAPLEEEDLGINLTGTGNSATSAKFKDTGRKNVEKGSRKTNPVVTCRADFIGLKFT
jgi:hypothetical protein